MLALPKNHEVWDNYNAERVLKLLKARPNYWHDLSEIAKLANAESMTIHRCFAKVQGIDISPLSREVTRDVGRLARLQPCVYVRRNGSDRRELCYGTYEAANTSQQHRDPSWVPGICFLD